jgi:hypothetical protein
MHLPVQGLIRRRSNRLYTQPAQRYCISGALSGDTNSISRDHPLKRSSVLIYWLIGEILKKREYVHNIVLVAARADGNLEEAEW